MAKLLGIDYQGTRYQEVEVRLLTIGGECTVQEMIVELGLNKDTLTLREEKLLDMVYLSQQIRIEGIPQAVLTPQFLLDNLAQEDYWRIVEAQLALRKKLSADGESLNLHAEPSDKAV